MSKNQYCDNNHVLGIGFHIAVASEPFLLRCNGKEWLTEWHYYFGPIRLHKRTKDPLTRQPGARDLFWLVASWWKEQGGLVVDGVGAWKEPPITISRFKKIGRSIVSDPAGDIIIRRWKGYEHWGNPVSVA